MNGRIKWVAAAIPELEKQENSLCDITELLKWCHVILQQIVFFFY